MKYIFSIKEDNFRFTHGQCQRYHTSNRLIHWFIKMINLILSVHISLTTPNDRYQSNIQSIKIHLMGKSSKGECRQESPWARLLSQTKQKTIFKFFFNYYYYYVLSLLQRLCLCVKGTTLNFDIFYVIIYFSIVYIIV